VSAESADHRLVRTGPSIIWPGVAIAVAEVLLLVVVLLVVFSGRLLLVGAALAGLVAVGVIRVRREGDALVLHLNLLAFQSEATLRDVTWRATGPGGDDPEGSGVREPRRPFGSGPRSALAQLEQPRD
jgi:hypothetical protein